MSKETVRKLSRKLLRRSNGRRIAFGDRVLVYYQGTLLNGEEFDANFDFSTFEQVAGRDPFPFNLGVGQVIEGWDRGLRNRRIGSVVELTIPATQAYGEAGAGELIPPNSPLKFKVEILAALPAGSTTAVFADYSDFGIDTKEIGLSDELIQTTQSLKIGLNAADELVGNGTNDLLIGLRGNDLMTGKRGADVLIGGEGRNTYIYESVRDSLASRRGGRARADHILDFGNRDRIDLSAVAKELRFIGEDRFTGTPGEVRFKKGTLELDRNGNGTANLALQLPGTDILRASNLIL